MRNFMRNTLPPVSLQARDSAVTDCELLKTQELGSAKRLKSDYLYQAATVAAVILVLLSI
jgi:hypothetical protein